MPKVISFLSGLWPAMSLMVSSGCGRARLLKVAGSAELRQQDHCRTVVIVAHMLAQR